MGEPFKPPFTVKELQGDLGWLVLDAGKHVICDGMTEAEVVFIRDRLNATTPADAASEREAFDFRAAWDKPCISADTLTRAVDVHVQHASPQVGRFGSDDDIRFFALALAGEAGELANVVKKAWRDGNTLNREAALEELAGTACYLVGMAAALGCDLDAEMNKQMTAFENRPERAVKTCPACNGSGSVGVYSDDGSPYPCGECDGEGVAR